jgi:peptidoglycan-associated lipoprotein
MKASNGLWLILLAALWLAGCATASKTEAPPVEDKTAGAETAGTGERGAAAGAPLAGDDRGAAQADLLAKRRIHFAFDSSTIDDESRAIIEAHATYLGANPQIKVRLEGHCDERGTREYNLALGERRAQAVDRLMKVLGISSSRLATATYGEEKPIDPEHNESAWRVNRRVEIIY